MVMRTVLVAAVLIAASTAVAHADAPGNTPQQFGDNERPSDPFPSPVMAQPVIGIPEAPPPVADKSPELAAALSIGATTLGYALMAAGDQHKGALETGALLAFLGPSTGQWYAGKVGGAGIGARAIALGVMVYGLAHMSVAEADCSDCGRSSSQDDARNAKTYLIAGAALWFGSTAYDIYEAYHQTEAYNEHQHNLARMFAPTMMQSPNNAMVPGVAFSSKF